VKAVADCSQLGGGSRELSTFLSLKDAFTTSMWKPFRRVLKSSAWHMAKPSLVGLATA